MGSKISVIALRNEGHWTKVFFYKNSEKNVRKTTLYLLTLRCNVQ